MKNAKVLIVEDELIIATDIRNILMSSGYNVTAIAVDGEETIQSIKKEKPDIILMDIVLSGSMDGIETADYIKQNFQVPVVFLTSHSDEKTLNRAKYTEPYGYILKPIHKNELTSTIETVLYRYELELKLRESEQKYRLVVSNADESIFILQNGILNFVNPAVSRITGKPEETLLNNNFFDLVYPEDREYAESVYNDDIKSSGGKKTYQFRIVDSNGVLKIIEVHPVLIEWLGREATINFMKDVTELRNMVEALRISEEKFSKAFSFSPNAITISTLDNDRFIEVNDNFLTFTGYERKELIGLTGESLKLWVDVENRKQFITRLSIEGSIREYETPFRTKSGEIRFASLSASIIEIDNSLNIVTVMMDTTVRKKLEDEILKAQKMESVGILAGGIAHDFNNLLTVISGNIAFIKMISTEDPELKECITEIEKASIQAKNLSSQLLNFSSLSRPVITKTNLKDLLDRRAMISRIPRTVDMEIKLDPKLWSLRVDPDQIYRVMGHIVDNACEAIDNKGTIIITAENYKVEKQKYIPIDEGNYVKISVKDNGVGIPQENISKIFDPYFTTKRKYSEKGMGLGLSISYAVIKRHHGYINLESTPGQGTTFYLYLPAEA